MDVCTVTVSPSADRVTLIGVKIFSHPQRQTIAAIIVKIRFI
jgi:hypothetical protein